MKSLVSLILIATWLIGVVIAQGFWSTLIAVLFPLWGHYLFVEWFIVGYL